VDVESAVGVSVTVGGIIVIAGNVSVTEAGEGEFCSSIHGGGGTSDGGAPQPNNPAAKAITMKIVNTRTIYFPARRLVLRAVTV